MIRAAAVFATILALPGCVFYTDDPGPKPAPNAAPYFTFAEAWCEPDDYYHDFVWSFDADVEDPDGSNDVAEVFVDVYDAWDGTWVDGFPLDRIDGITWYSAWVGASTYLDCTYPDYEVDFTAVDIFGAADTYTVLPYTW